MMETVGYYVEGIVETASLETAKETVKKLKASSPKNNGKYAKAWTFTPRNNGLSKSYVVHVKAPHYRLTHLLEYGHATRNGGRVPARPHIATAEKEAIEEFTKKVVQGIEES
ncbi:HK97 gp10 family phage protein [Acetoanaerobium noterae]|nr:HK97 gp10 family phage protein [Acetoanaerobium noterae]